MIQQITFIGQPEVSVAAAAVAVNMGVECTGVPRFSGSNLQWTDGTVVFTDGGLCQTPPVAFNLAESVNHPVLYVDIGISTDAKTISRIHNWICSNNIERLNIIGDNGRSPRNDFHSTLFIVRGLILEGWAERPQSVARD